MSTERVSDEELAQAITAQSFSTDLAHNHFIMSVCRELQQRRETDRKVINAYQNVMGITKEDYDDRLEKAISELLP